MPAGMVRPRASLAPRLGAGAVLDYRECGWRISAGGRVETGQCVGPCVTCGEPTVRYGPYGRPVCPECSTDSTTPGNGDPTA